MSSVDSGISKMEVYRLENQRTGDPHVSTVIKLAKALEIDEAELIHGCDRRKRRSRGL